MTSEKFAGILGERLQKIRNVLANKANEYATDDRLHNFKSAGELGGTPAEICWGYMLKHLQSVRDLALGIKPLTLGMIDEKIGDSLCYLILMEAIFREYLEEDNATDQR